MPAALRTTVREMRRKTWENNYIARRQLVAYVYGVQVGNKDNNQSKEKIGYLRCGNESHACCWLESILEAQFM